MFSKNKNKDVKKDTVIDQITAKEYAYLSTHERQNWRAVNPRYEHLPLFSKISFILAGVSIIIYLIACLSPTFADFFNTHISGFLRLIFAKISGVIPFSLAEAMIILVPLIFFFVIKYFVKHRSYTWRTTWIAAGILGSVVTLILSIFILNFGVGYRGTTLDQKLELEREEVSAQDLYKTAVYLAEQTEALSHKVAYDTQTNLSVMPYSFDEMNDKLLLAYDSFCMDNSFLNTFNSSLKPVLFSEVMSYAHITGVYSFFTGEANINIGFPDYTVVFTAAHELAHQRGIAREDEANMIAFLVCISSQDPYIQYSGYLNMYEYVSAALYRADKDLYAKATTHLSPSIVQEQIAFNDFFDKYTNSFASVVSGAVNDTYLQMQGTQGTKSYGMVVDLTVAYFKNENLISD